ncbi:2,5-diketo-D-gluconic acid reductase A [Amniculicola lignicola CBS 123094]|uniref:2,5-diketo-D-gluconic acid reductase A n=1 Tax=Amniculicola lignicola CBS 123094 TaxID=1392246 RepID=A0A6A5WYY2_9PLEO|nr:2,5-diketo-D-gluconic acid reductase A [Amniculicola lignicola CBS 123094]
MSPLTLTSTYPLPSGHKIPILGYGVYQTPAAIASSVVQHALQTGYRHVDSAVAYRNEGPSAQGIKDSGISRSELFFTTKIPPKDMGYASAKQHIAQSLQETGFDYIDLYLLHAPYGGKAARLGAWKALVEGVAAGQIRSIGVSNYGVHHLEELEAYIKTTDAEEGAGAGGVLSVNQIELHPWLGRKDIVAWCKERGVVLEAYCPIVRGERLEDPLLVPIAKKYGKTTAQVLLRWSLQMEFVPLPKTVTKSRIEENADIYDFELTEEEMKTLDTGVDQPIAWDPTVSHD